MFHQRFDTAQQLIGQPQQYRDSNARILSIPTGGLPMASLLVPQFPLPEDIALTKQMEYSLHKGLARGCVIHVHSPGYNDVPQPCVDGETKQIGEDLKQKYKFYKGGLEENSGQSKQVIWIDDKILYGKHQVGYDSSGSPTLLVRHYSRGYGFISGCSGIAPE